MTLAVASRRGRRAVVVLALSGLVTVACRHDGRDLRDPSSPLPPTTTTSTTLPPDVVANTIDVATP
jgi:hypothetical protein